MALLGLHCFSRRAGAALELWRVGLLPVGAPPCGAPHCGSLSCSRARGLSYSIAHRLVQDQELNWCPLHCRLNCWTSGEKVTRGELPHPLSFPQE